MATIKLALLRHTRAKDGTYKIRIAVGHRSETHYIVTKYKVNSPSDFTDGIVVHIPNAHAVNIKLRNLLNDYEERLDRIPCPNDYTCQELRDMLKSMRPCNLQPHQAGEPIRCRINIVGKEVPVLLLLLSPYPPTYSWALKHFGSFLPPDFSHFYF